MVYFYIQRYLNHYSLYNIVNRNILLNALYLVWRKITLLPYKSIRASIFFKLVVKFIVIASKAVETTEKIGSETNFGYEYSMVDILLPVHILNGAIALCKCCHLFSVNDILVQRYYHDMLLYNCVIANAFTEFSIGHNIVWSSFILHILDIFIYTVELKQ